MSEKLRTVFNGSARDFNNISLNDILHTGANLLPDLSELLLHWMSYRYVFVCDIKQTFRRMVVFRITKLFDPLGWLVPVMITAKVIIQKLWLARLKWEDVLPDDLKTECIEL